jgi:hypothetical protein
MPTKEQKLKAIIEKGIKGGYKYEYPYEPKVLQYNNYYYIVIFDHDFAKAIWGEEEGIFDCPYGCEDSDEDQEDFRMEVEIPKWQYHLQQAVISKDPIQYYYDHL